MLSVVPEEGDRPETSEYCTCEEDDEGAGADGADGALAFPATEDGSSAASRSVRPDN
ncbi:hypothetical protein D3C76_1801890 [compost metagenome]